MTGIDAFFRPRSVAVVGATDTPASVGQSLWANLTGAGFAGSTYAVNPHRSEVGGQKSYGCLAEIPGPVDLVLIATPAPTVPAIVQEAVAKKAKAAVILSGGFREVGESGRELERRIQQAVGGSGLRLLGPNCLGLMNPYHGLNATFAQGMARAGGVAFVSQSGALCTAVLDWSLRANVGFSTFVSAGSMLDAGWGDLIDYLGDDPHTRAILLYIESIQDPGEFLSAAREVALRKPIIAVKAGRTAAASRAAVAHTGAETGSDAIIDAAFRRCGVLRVNRISDLFYMAGVLARQPRPQGPRLTIVTNAGGPGVLAADALIGAGGELAEVPARALAAINQFAPAHWSHGNPIDLLGDATATRFEQTLDLVAKAPESDGLLVIMVPVAVESMTQVAEVLVKFAKVPGRPVLASFMGGAAASAAAEVVEKAGIPNFPYPDSAARAFASMWQYARELKSLYETPIPMGADRVDRERAREICRQARETRTRLEDAEVAALLFCYGIPMGPAHGRCALMLTMRLDPQFGPVLGCSVQGALPAGISLGFPPLNSTLAQRMLDHGGLDHILRHHHANREALAETLIRFAALISDLPAIAECQLALQAGEDCLVTHGMVRLHAADVDLDGIPPAAIRPYPIQYVWDEGDVTIRPIRPEDEPALIQFHQTLSEQTVYFRYFSPVRLSHRISHERLSRICFIDFAREMALVAESGGVIMAVGRLTRIRGTRHGEFAVVVSDQFQRRGLGTRILKRLQQIAREEKMTRVIGDILPENRGMQRTAEKAGFTLAHHFEEGVMRASFETGVA
jgi:acetyl coenzyme A synthetase (ADP forming)-like protein